MRRRLPEVILKALGFKALGFAGQFPKPRGPGTAKSQLERRSSWTCLDGLWTIHGDTGNLLPVEFPDGQFPEAPQ
jgi:hypothetical protein